MLSMEVVSVVRDISSQQGKWETGDTSCPSPSFKASVFGERIQ